MGYDGQGFVWGGTVQSYRQYKISLAIFLVSMLLADYIHQKRNPVYGQEEYWFTGGG